MTKSTASLSFPDVNVWMAIVIEHHIHRRLAKAWWKRTEGTIAFTRFTQVGVLRLLTTSAAMDGKPLAMNEAWRVYDRLFADDRVVLFPEPGGVEEPFRMATSAALATPKLWTDAWLLAVANSAAGILITFDRALSARGAHCLLEARS